MNQVESLRYGVAALSLRVGEGSERAQWPLPGLWSFVQEEAVPWHLPWCQTPQFLPICSWGSSSCCPGAGAQREWICVSYKTVLGPLRGAAWVSPFILLLHPYWFLQTEVIGLTFLALEPWAGWSVVGLGSFAPEVSLQIFILHPWVWDHPFCLSSPPTHLDECDFFNSLVVELPYSLIFWWFWVVVVLTFICKFCCGCVRTAVCTSILTGGLALFVHFEILD